MTSTAAISSTVLDQLNGKTATAAANEAGSSDRFLKLLVTQLQNQDPLNPMDNAQITSQMAQINTVNGIEKLNTTVQGLSGQFMQMQALQGAALVGNEVVVPGNQLRIEGGVGQGGFELGVAADRVKVEILNAGGHVVDTVDLGAQGKGTHSFDWPAGTQTAGLTFKVTATSGAATVPATALMSDTVKAVSTAGNELMLELDHAGTVSYSQVKAFQ
jgi:flagellar basal-body rod modification protein FlgD